MDDFQAGHVYNITIPRRAVPVKTKWPKYWQGETRGHRRDYAEKFRESAVSSPSSGNQHVKQKWWNRFVTIVEMGRINFARILRSSVSITR